MLDKLQHKGNVNTVWAYTFGCGEQRLKKGNSLPDHGIPGSTETIGGVFYDYDAKYFQNTMLKDFRAARYGKFNVIEQVAPKVKARGWTLSHGISTTQE